MIAVSAVVVSGGFLSASAGATVTRQAVTAPSQELPPLRALNPIGSKSAQGYVTGYPTFRWKFPARDGSAQYWVTMDDTPLLSGVHLGGDTFAYVTDWFYSEGIPLSDGASSGPGWFAYFWSNKCNGQNDWAIFGASEYTMPCPEGAWDEIIGDLDALPGAWIHVGPSFEACAQGVQLWGGSCYARFISSSEMSTLVTPVTDVEVWDTQPWDVLCPVSDNAPSCWTADPAPPGYGVTVQALPVSTPVDQGTTSDSFSIRVSNPNMNAVTVSAVSAELPTGFAYVRGTTTGSSQATRQ